MSYELRPPRKGELFIVESDVADDDFPADQERWVWTPDETAACNA